MVGVALGIHFGAEGAAVYVRREETGDGLEVAGEEEAVEGFGDGGGVGFAEGAARDGEGDGDGVHERPGVFFGLDGFGLREVEDGAVAQGACEAFADALDEVEGAGVEEVLLGDFGGGKMQDLRAQPVEEGVGEGGEKHKASTSYDGRWRMEDGGWTMDDGGWRMEDGRWRMEDGRWRI